jgi:cytoskeletal protein CcmA (bactofilin family)
MALFSGEPDRSIRPEIVPGSQSTTLQNSESLSEHSAAPLRQTSVAPREGGAYLNRGSKINGNLTFESQARIDGQVEGEIIAKDDLMIGETAIVTAQIKAASIVVAGTVKGAINAVQRVEIRPSAKVFGNVSTPKLVVHEGAIFEGHCAMPSEASRDERKIAAVTKEDRKVPQAAMQKPA